MLVIGSDSTFRSLSWENCVSIDLQSLLGRYTANYKEIDVLKNEPGLTKEEVAELVQEMNDNYDYYFGDLDVTPKKEKKKTSTKNEAKPQEEKKE